MLKKSIAFWVDGASTLYICSHTHFIILRNTEFILCMRRETTGSRFVTCETSSVLGVLILSSNSAEWCFARLLNLIWASDDTKWKKHDIKINCLNITNWNKYESNHKNIKWNSDWAMSIRKSESQNPQFALHKQNGAITFNRYLLLIWSSNKPETSNKLSGQ